MICLRICSIVLSGIFSLCYRPQHGLYQAPLSSWLVSPQIAYQVFYQSAEKCSVNHNNQVIDDSVVHEINGAAPISERMAAVGEENQLQSLKKRIEACREIKPYLPQYPCYYSKGYDMCCKHHYHQHD